ncbi:unnamed protein product [Ascophyllum nodosum]
MWPERSARSLLSADNQSREKCPRTRGSHGTGVVTHHPRRETSFIASAIRDWPASESQRLHVTSMEGSGEGGDRREIVVVGLNGALQRTVVFQPPKGLRVGGVNRASYVGAGIGGKGQNVCVALTMMSEGDRNEENEAGVHITLAHFSGGKSGESVCERLAGLGVSLVTAETEADMRQCTSLVDERLGETTEIIEPWTAKITEKEQQGLVEACKATFAELARVHGVAVMGSSPDGVGEQTHKDIMSALAQSPGFMGADTRVVVDSLVGFQALVDTGHVSLLKVNAEEVLSLAETGRADGGGDSEATVWMEDKLASAAAELFGRHGQCLPWIAVTNGGLPCYLFSREFLEDDGTLSSFWRLNPAPVNPINPIGAGDAVAAATLYEWTRGAKLPEAFRRGLSVGGAACTSRDPLCSSSFSLEEANRLLPEVRMEQIMRKK